MIPMRFFGTILAFAAFGIGLAASAAVAQQSQQQPTSALKGHDKSAPVDVTADRIEVQDRADRAIFAGNVHVKQAELSLDTPRLTIAYSSSGGVRSPSETAKGVFGVYDLDRRLITLIGNVQLNRGANQVNGSRLVIDLESGRAVIDGGPPGVNQSGGRVTGHFTVPQRKQR